MLKDNKDFECYLKGEFESKSPCRLSYLGIQPIDNCKQMREIINRDMKIKGTRKNRVLLVDSESLPLISETHSSTQEI